MRKMLGQSVFNELPGVLGYVLWFLVWLAGLAILVWLLGVRYIPHNKVGIVEKMWSFRGSLKQGQIIALGGEAGFQASTLRGGLHFFYFPFQYRVPKVPLVGVAEGRIGYVYARGGVPLSPTQTLGKVVDCNNFQDTTAFLQNGGQRGRQRGMLREGVYAINLAQFVVITETRFYAGPVHEDNEDKFENWRGHLASIGGFSPVVIGQGRSQGAKSAEAEPISASGLSSNDTIGVLIVHDGPPLEQGEIIAPEIKSEGPDSGHNCFQDPEAFLALGGRRGKQLQVLTDGTYFINRWFATVETSPKTLIQIGYVGVVVSYCGAKSEDVTGEGFRYGEQVADGHRGVWKRALTPGKYPLNPYAVAVELVPTTNFVLRWITGSVEAHNYDKDLKSIELITADGYEPTLPLSLVLHIDYENAPRVVQRFGNVTRLITQTLDPILSAYFRDVAQDSKMLDLLTHREQIQKSATDELSRRFKEYDINCIAVLIGRPETKPDQYKPGQDPIEQLFDQLRARRLAEEQLATFGKQEEAAKRLKALNDAEAAARKQAELTQTKIDIEIAGNRGEAQFSEAKRLAERDVVRADGEARSKELIGRGTGKATELEGTGQASAIQQVGSAEADVFGKKVRAYGDPRLFALQGAVERLANSKQALVPERLMVMRGGADGESPEAGGALGLLSQLVALMIAEKSGLNFGGGADISAEDPSGGADMRGGKPESYRSLADPMGATAQKVDGGALGKD
jgi:uncharacterized membrane protein YqiK